MADISFALIDPELGYTAFQVLRDFCTLSRGTTSRSREILSAGGCIHPGTPEMAELLPEEERHRTFIVIYTPFALSMGENPGGTEYTAPDRILYGGRIWKLVRIRDWSAFGYFQGLATLTDEVQDDA